MRTGWYYWGFGGGGGEGETVVLGGLTAHTGWPASFGAVAVPTSETIARIEPFIITVHTLFFDRKPIPEISAKLDDKGDVADA